MRRALACLLLILAGCAARPGVCRPGQSPAPRHAVPDPVAGYHRLGHAHNDYEHAHPLEDALEQRFYSVEADIWFDGGRFSVSHLGVGSKGTLAQLYLDPLQARVSRLGSVHGDGLQFVLWIDIKDSDPQHPQALHDLLERYPMLSRFTDAGEVEPGPVVAVLTGDDAMKRAQVERFASRRAVRDSNDFSLTDPPADGRWRYYALAWGDYLSSDSQGHLDAENQRRLACLLENAHALGRQVRLYDAPDVVSSWSVQLAHGADFINTDDLPGLAGYFQTAPDR